VWAEKTPRNILALQWIRKRWPNARFIHVVRDGRDVVCSLMEHPKWRINEKTQKLERTGARQNPRLCIDRWVTEVPMGLKFRSDPLYFEVRYEELVLEPRRIMGELLHFLDLEWDERVLEHEQIKRNPLLDPQSSDGISKPIYQHSIARWGHELPTDVLNQLYKQGAWILRKLNYIS